MERGQRVITQFVSHPPHGLPRARPTKPDPMRSREGSAPAIVTRLSATASTTAPGGWGDRGGCLPSSRNGLQCAIVLEQRCREPEALADKPLDPPDPPIPLSNREPLGGVAASATEAPKSPVPIWPIPCLAPPTLPWRCSPRERCCSREELSTRHHTPGEGLLMTSVGRDGTRGIGVDCFIHIRNSRSLPRSQSPRAAGICSTPPIWELGLNLLLVALLQVNRVG